MVKALASTGLASTKEQLKAVRSGMTNNKVNSASASEVKLVDWHLKRDTVMASTANHHEGDDPNVSRLINLIKTGDSSFQHWAVERMNWDKILDPRLMAVLASQVQSYVDRGGGALDEVQDDTLANFVKLLGYSKDVQYRPLLEKVNSLSSATPAIKRHSKYALAKL